MRTTWKLGWCGNAERGAQVLAKPAARVASGVRTNGEARPGVPVLLLA
jgi:hypothetical protein